MDTQVGPSAIVYMASFAALLGALSMGLGLGYTAPAFIDMEKDPSNILGPNAENAKSWVGSILAIGALIGGFLGEPCNKIMGRRLSLIAYGIPFALGWLVMALSNGLVMLLVGRALTGLGCGLVSGTAPTYVVEIATSNIRGLLGTCFQVMVVIGILMAAVLGTFLSWYWLAGVSVAAPLCMSVLMMCMPETPIWLLSVGRHEEAEFSMKRLRIGPINSEFDSLVQAANANAEQNAGVSSYSCQVLKSPEFLISFVLALGLMFFQQFSGINAVLFYQSDIFKDAAPKLDAAQATIYVCVAQVISTILGSVLVDRLGRKILLLASGVGHTISLVVFGLYSHISQSDKTFQADFAWISLLSLIIFISSFSIGFGPIPWMMIPEFTPGHIRSMVAALATAFNWTCVFFVTLYVKPYIELVGSDWTYWTFSMVCVVSCVFVGLALPETKGRAVV